MLKKINHIINASKTKIIAGGSFFARGAIDASGRMRQAGARYHSGQS